MGIINAGAGTPRQDKFTCYMKDRAYEFKQCIITSWDNFST
jgi:hypothetical protein